MTTGTTMNIQLDQVQIRFPIYESDDRSFKRTLLSAAGGRILKDPKNRVEIEALRDINLRIQHGERVALLGHNGSGKTTLLRVLAGVYTPVSGQVSVSGRITSLLDSMLGMDPELTGLENIRLRLLFMGKTRSQSDALIDGIVEFSELGDFIYMPVRTYSSGMVLRLAFAISTSVAPDILLMDEWMSVGDEQFRDKAEARLKSYVDAAGILVMATHDEGLARRSCNRIIRMAHGVIQEDQPA
ncbi:ABC transporter ATP-binding protein [Saccharospirillum mangrovi]|uniref:ABC transporter ATP-binding protein n=1 Tax=Saccharospirillum mangrovi TaxID=2161747 RepID=UPI0018E59D0E|nr:ABC transporter ATP-binding protein [Saccharospirillum mangrovi]